MNKRLGDILIERGYLDDQQVQQALEIQQNTGNEGMWRYIGQILIEMGVVDQKQVNEGLGVLKSYNN